jgi:hypothetical protein
MVVIVWLLDLQLPMQSLPLTTNNSEFESHSGRDITKILLKGAFNTIAIIITL